MPITRGMVEARLSELKRQLEQAISNLNAVHGAIQATEYWLTVLDSQEKPEDQNSRAP